MSAIGPGDWVECLKTEKPRSNERRGIFSVGRVYFVIRITPTGGLVFKDMPTPQEFGIICSPLVGWHPDYFRPIYRPKESFIESLKEPTFRLVEA